MLLVNLLTEKPNYVVPSKKKKTAEEEKKEEIFGRHFTEGKTFIFYLCKNIFFFVDPVEEAFSNEKLFKTLTTISLVPK